MSASAGAVKNSFGSSPFETALNTHHLRDVVPPRKPLKSCVDEAEQSPTKNDKRQSDISLVNRPKSYSVSSRTTVASDAHHHEHGDVRTLPPWIDSFEESDDEFTASRPTDMLLKSPPQAHSAQHHFAATKPERRRSQDGYIDSDDDMSSGTPAKSPERGFFGGSKEPDKGRKWDHARQGDPVVVQAGVPSSWKNFVKSSMYGPSFNEDGKRVDESFLEELTPGYVRPWRGDVEGADLEKALGLTRRKIRQRIWYQRIQHVIVMHPLVPLFIRMVVLTTSTLALGLSCSIFHLTDNSTFPQTPSTIMAIIVDVVAMPYIGYITWDEYTGKPLGLRSPKAKMRLVLLDLLFIVFESANLSLTLASLADGAGICEDGYNGSDFAICHRVRTLSAFLFIALVAWILTFNVSIFRLIHRVRGDRDDME